LNGNITTSSPSYGSGIGSASTLIGDSNVVNLTIVNGNITTSSSSYGSGIGGGYREGNSWTSDQYVVVQKIRILNGNIIATSSSYGSGIGSAFSEYRNGLTENLLIMGGRIPANETLAGIGYNGFNDSVNLNLTGNAVLTCNANFTTFPVRV
jgi:hypothetical protein